MKLTVAVCAIAFALSLPAGSWGADAEKDHFDKMDTDKSGTVSIDEFINAPFSKLKTKEGLKLVPSDTEHAEPLSLEEKHQIFKSIDKDKSNHISRKEWITFKDGQFFF